MKIIRKGDRFPLKKGISFVLDLSGIMVPAVYTRGGSCYSCPIHEDLWKHGNGVSPIGCIEWVSGCTSGDYHVVSQEEVVE